MLSFSHSSSSARLLRVERVLLAGDGTALRLGGMGVLDFVNVEMMWKWLKRAPGLSTTRMKVMGPLYQR
jgi:hypothetical protein